MKKCSKHPKYRGKRQPKHECLDCLNFYFKQHTAPRAPIKHTKIFKDGKTYNRKTKHKNQE